MKLLTFDISTPFKYLQQSRTENCAALLVFGEVKIQKRPSGTFLTHDYLLLNITHPPQWEGQSGKRFPSTEKRVGRRSSGTLAKAKRLSKMSGNWSLTLPLPVATVPSTGSPIPLPAFSCITYVARLDFTGEFRRLRTATRAARP
jgi:hypothetical protein